MSHYPNEIQDFHQTIMKLKGITEIESGVDNLAAVDAEVLRFPPFAHLPHAALLRTGGGMENEVLIQFEIGIEYSVEGLEAIEFLAWFVRDAARGGTKIQMRPFALPPDSPLGRQLGTSLKFHIELFVDGIEDTLEPAYKVIQRLNQTLETAIGLYDIPVKPTCI
ncbi:MULTISPECIES: hypothetical protein [Paenibacillus]|uniref:hypothetical protein n=1 Tax=Paenibacillus TaxID=44249 RepID=UPI002FE36E8B